MDVETTLINRIVAFIVTPIITAIAGLGTVVVEGWLSTDLDDQEVAAIAVAVAVLAGAQCVNWLRNLHLWQAGKQK